MEDRESRLPRRRERRRHSRKACALRAEYEVGGKEYFGLVSDVSLGGMCLEAGQVHAIGDTITVTLYTGAEQTLVLRGVVAYVLEADSYWRLGVEFDEVNQAAMDALALYLVT